MLSATRLAASALSMPRMSRPMTGFVYGRSRDSARAVETWEVAAVEVMILVG